MEGSEVLSIRVREVNKEKGGHLTEIMINCNMPTLIVGLSEAIIKVNNAINRSGKLPKNMAWTLVCELVSDTLLEESKKM